jgi:hypothetical protein
VQRRGRPRGPVRAALRAPAPPAGGEAPCPCGPGSEQATPRAPRSWGQDYVTSGKGNESPLSRAEASAETRPQEPGTMAGSARNADLAAAAGPLRAPRPGPSEGRRPGAGHPGRSGAKTPSPGGEAGGGRRPRPAPDVQAIVPTARDLPKTLARPPRGHPSRLLHRAQMPRDIGRTPGPRPPWKCRFSGPQLRLHGIFIFFFFFAALKFELRAFTLSHSTSPIFFFFFFFF